MLKIISKQDSLIVSGHMALFQSAKYQGDLLPTEVLLRYPKYSTRQIALQEIDGAMASVLTVLQAAGFQVSVHKKKRQIETLQVHLQECVCTIKAESVNRGTLLPLTKATIEDIYFQSISLNEAYAETLFLGLHRQRPEDFYHIALIWDEIQNVDVIRQLLVAIIASSPRPMHESIHPANVDLKTNEFLRYRQGNASFNTLEELYAIRSGLIQWVKSNLTENEKHFLLSVKKGKPEFERLPFHNLKDSPAMLWKLSNIKKLHYEKQVLILNKLERLFDVSN